MFCVVEGDTSAFQDVNAKFKPDTVTAKSFEQELEQFLLVIGLAAKSIKCLKSSHATASDVYLFWLSVMASLDDLIKADKLNLPLPVVKKIRRLCNYRFNKMINEGPSDVFVTAFFLDPRMLFWFSTFLQETDCR